MWDDKRKCWVTTAKELGLPEHTPEEMAALLKEFEDATGMTAAEAAREVLEEMRRPRKARRRTAII